MGVSATQLASLLAQQESNVTDKRDTPDHMSGGVTETLVSEEKDEDWVDLLANVADTDAKNMYSMLNMSAKGALQGSRNSLILSAEGFGISTKVNYLFSAPGSYTPWTKDDNREVTQVVLHSFGQSWHAFESGDTWLGKMNESGGSHRIIDPTTANGKPIWVPKGTNVNTGMSNTERFTSSLRYLINPIEGVYGTHFVINRTGDLFVLGDCNSVFESSGILSESSISIGLEEAMYLETEGFDAQRLATWLPGGDPPGTEGTLSYWDYSKEQYLTLATLIQKLQQAYPPLRTENYSTTINSVDTSFTGYTMHGHILGAGAKHVDVSPHFQDSETWNNFFTLVAAQSQVVQYNVWKEIDEGYLGEMEWVDSIVNSVGKNAATLSAQISVNPAIPILTGIYRSQQEAAKSSADYREDDAAQSYQESTLQLRRKGVGKMLNDVINIPPRVMSTTQDYEDEDFTVDTIREIGLDVDKLYS